MQALCILQWIHLAAGSFRQEQADPTPLHPTPPGRPTIALRLRWPVVASLAALSLLTGDSKAAVIITTMILFSLLIAFLDPPKDSAAQAIRDLNRGGVAVEVLTGDNPVIARKTCKDVELAVEGVLLGQEIEAMDDATLGELVESTTIFAKLSPLQKSRIIKLLRNRGHVVGFMGDGINDAAALREADIGFSVDTAVDIAKESADIVLLEKSLLVLNAGVMEGRRTFGNIIKYIKMGTSSAFGNMFSMLGGASCCPFCRCCRCRPCSTISFTTSLRLAFPLIMSTQTIWRYHANGD